MGLFSFLGKKNEERDFVSEASNVTQLFDILCQRKGWRELGPELLKSICDNSNDNVATIKLFVSLVENRNMLAGFLEAAKEPGRENAVTLFAALMCTLGDAHAAEFEKEVITVRSGKNRGRPDAILQDIRGQFLAATAFFNSAVLCDPYFLPAYVSVARLWLKGFGQPSEMTGYALERAEQGLAMAHKMTNDPSVHLTPLNRSDMEKSIDRSVRELLQIKQECLSARNVAPAN